MAHCADDNIRRIWTKVPILNRYGFFAVSNYGMAWIAVVFMGLVLGLLGSGGGILTVPILVGLFGIPAVKATGLSLGVVGTISLIGAAQGILRRQADFRAALWLALPAMAGSVVARAVLLPRVPERIGGWSRDDVLILLFSAVLLTVGWQMLRQSTEDPCRRRHGGVIASTGFAIGLASGILGAGGGFLIVPALTLVVGMEMRRAIPSSLVVIALQSLAGFAGELGQPIDWRFLVMLVAVALIGMTIGLIIRPRVSTEKLRLMFALLLFVVAVWMAITVFLNRS